MRKGGGERNYRRKHPKLSRSGGGRALRGTLILRGELGTSKRIQGGLEKDGKVNRGLRQSNKRFKETETVPAPIKAKKRDQDGTLREIRKGIGKPGLKKKGGGAPYSRKKSQVVGE